MRGADEAGCAPVARLEATGMAPPVRSVRVAFEAAGRQPDPTCWSSVLRAEQRSRQAESGELHTTAHGSFAVRSVAFDAVGLPDQRPMMSYSRGRGSGCLRNDDKLTTLLP